MSTSAGHRAPEPRTVRLAGVMLLTGAVLAVAAALGPAWLARVGIGIALVGGVGGCWLLWRAVRAERRAAGERLVAQARAHGAALRAERRQGAEVLAVVTHRLDATGESLARARTTLAAQRRELAALRSRPATPAAGRGEQSASAEVLALPRRRKRGGGHDDERRARRA